MSKRDRHTIRVRHKEREREKDSLSQRLKEQDSHIKFFKGPHREPSIDRYTQTDRPTHPISEQVVL